MPLLADPDAWWRETAQRLLIERRDRASIPLLQSLADPQVPTALGRVHALWTLDSLNLHNGLGDHYLIIGLTDPESGVREQAVRLSEKSAAKSPTVFEKLCALADDPDAMVRLQVAFSLGEVFDYRSLPPLVSIAVRDSGDRWIRTAVLSSISGRTSAFIDRLAAVPGFLASPQGRTWLDELCVLVGSERKPAEIQAVLARFGGEDADSRLLGTVVLGLGRGLQRSGGSLREALRGPGAERLEPIFARARKTAESDGPASERLDAIRLLGLGPIEPIMDVLPDLLDARQPGAVQLAALQALAALNDRRVGAAVVAHWKALSPSVRREAIEVLFARPERIAALIDGVSDKTIAASDLDPVRRKQLLALPDPKQRERAVRLFGTEVRSDRGTVVEAFRKSLALTGERDRGREVFKKTCATCHKAEGVGIDVGPNLVTVATRAPDDILVHILDPNREVAPQFVNYNIALTDGRTLSGMIADESTNAVTLKRAEGVTDVVPRARIEAIASTGLSLMPEGLEKGLEPRDIANLIAFLRSIK